MGLRSSLSQEGGYIDIIMYLNIPRQTPTIWGLDGTSLYPLNGIVYGLTAFLWNKPECVDSLEVLQVNFRETEEVDIYQ
jgi:hypothetical protein